MTTKPKPKATDNTARVKELLLWARKERIAVGHVHVGDVEMTVSDLGIGAGDPRPEIVKRRNIIEEYGGSALEHAERLGSTVDPTVEDDDDDDA